jgi:Rrf2 family iron-sulfur cluster assembly transcriptional regulator
MSNLLFSRSSSHAIRALTYLAMQPLGKFSGTREISEREHIPRAFIPKVLLPLRRARLVRSSRGIRGGYDLAVPPEQINLMAIICCIDGVPLNDCVLEDHPCSIPNECVLHPCWGVVREPLLGYLERTTLADLVRFRQSGSGEGCPDPNPPSRGVERREKWPK